MILCVPEGSIGDIYCGNVGDCQEGDKNMWNCLCHRPTHCPGEEKLGKEEPSNGGRWPSAGQEQRYHIFKRMPCCCTADSEEKVKGHSFFRSSYGTLEPSICEVLQLRVFSQSRDGITMASLDPYKESGCVVYLDPFGCCALWAIYYVFTLCGPERVRLNISVAGKFSEAIRQVNPGPLARLQSSQQQAQLGSENMCTWYLSLFRTFLKNLNWKDCVCTWVFCCDLRQSLDSFFLSVVLLWCLLYWLVLLVAAWLSDFQAAWPYPHKP